ncbi:MAG: chromosome segregation protein SMC [Smithellaceae bacterium]|nr:chromosome segregation protein SMC [Syntrophaceae bacterium]MDD4240515.1 chromosome segregation protein SMC [Smithellaceae bacterium]NLX51252.1 chromosome segregation protein SMC [Deltaproteobacteria bacterium]
MKLKRLEISGFKSFRDKVVIDFSRGINAVVGPNGCGKSNVVDAIRWVMGEQRVKALRGKKMDDVIFNGSEDAAPVSMAEVVMTLERDGSSFPGVYGELTEVSISRRAVLDGESEYCINRTPCRLLDVKEFFMGTGVGARTYSLVEQGSVATLVEAKPEDRRLFIEDAAGVSKYKSRKEAAVRKMEATKQNILRLNDIHKEVKSQLSAVTRQAKKAEQYKTVKQRIKETELTLARQGYVKLTEKNEALQTSRDAFLSQISAVRAQLEAKESTLAEMKAGLLENDEQINRCQTRLYEIKNTINIKEKNIEFSRRRMAESALRKEKNQTEIDALDQKKSGLVVEIENLQKKAADAFDRLAQLEQELQEGQNEVQGLLENDREINARLEEQKIRYIDVMQDLAKFNNVIAGLNKSMGDFQRREEREIREMEQDKGRLAELSGRLATLKEELARDEDEIDRLAEQREAAAEELDKARSDLHLVEERILQIREETGGKSSRLQSLQEFQAAFKWSNEGVKQVIEKQSGSNAFYGVVADHINVPREYESAVEAVLGDKLQYAVVKNQEEGLRAIDYLKNYHLGRGSFVPVELRGSNAETYSAEHLQEAEPLLRKVAVQEEFRQIADCLLGDVLLTPTIETGLNLWKKNGFRGTFVTPEGDTISPQGVLTGGSGSAVEKSLLATKREIAELENDVEKLTAELDSHLSEKKKLASAITRWDEELTGLKNRAHRLDIEINGRKKDLERFEDETGRLKQRLAVLEYNRQNIKTEEAQARQKLGEYQAEVQRKEAEEKELNEIISALNSRRQQSRSAIDAQEKRLTEKKVLLASGAEKRDGDLRTIARLQRDLGLTDGDAAQKRDEILACEAQIADLTASVEAENALLGSLYDELASCETDLAGLKDKRSGEDEQLRERENDIREVKKKLDDLTRQTNELEMQCREAALNIENLKNTVLEKHQVDLAALMADFETLGDDRIADLGSLLEKDKQTIDNFGEVNLLAINEYAELDQRNQFLTTQLADLNESLASLQRTITRINKISRDRFSETFAAVNACFKEVFAHIFPGGRGELLLTDESDLLETGVDIDIQIPGKKAQSVSLLSGGEKSLAAIGLIFAILMYRPTPFLILDEVDAALDDANTNLFNRLIRDVADKSQVIMITHNKSTMEVADILFGVTMQKQGISSLVSVTLN